MTENDDDDGTNAESNGERNASDLSEQEAYEMYEEKGRSYRQIAELYNTSHTTARRRVEAYRKGIDKGKETVTSNPEEYDLTEAIKDDEPDSTPYTTEVPCCNSTIDKPSKPGEHECPNCGQVLDWDASEI